MSFCQQRTQPFSAAHLAPDAAVFSLIYTVGLRSSALLRHGAAAGEGHGKVYFYMQILLIQYERFSSFTGCNSSPQPNTVSSSSIIRPFLWLKNRFSESLVHHSFHRRPQGCALVPPGWAETFLPVPELTAAAQGEQSHEQFDMFGLISG